jgi:hypothetical protein
MNDEPALARIAGARHFAHTMRDARVEDRQAIEARLHRSNQLGLFNGPHRPKVVPEVEHLVAHEQRLAATKLAALPVRERIDKRPRPVRQIAVQLLPAAVDVERQPRR